MTERRIEAAERHASAANGAPGAAIAVAGRRPIEAPLVLRALACLAAALGIAALRAVGYLPGPLQDPAPLAGDATLRYLQSGAAALVAMTFAGLLALPAAMVYVRTRSRHKYDSALVQTVIVLPVLVSAIVTVVQNSLALAFSLAGIVAAVRFRNDLKDSRDAVYILAAVAIGFAAGVDALGIALALAPLFVGLELLIWVKELGGEQHRAAVLWRLGPAAGAEHLGRNGGSPADRLLPAAPGADEGELPLRVLTHDVDDARRVAEQVLELRTKRWRLVQIGPAGPGTVGLDYLVRPRRKYPLQEVADEIVHRGVRVVDAVARP